MADTIIENPIINSPFEEPKRHFRFDDNGITNDIVEHRRVSAYFMPIAKPKKRGAQLAFDTEWTRDRLEENTQINRIRERVGLWRQGHYAGITPVTRRLLDYWTHPERDKRLFFCQIEALETIIYLTECGKKFGDTWIDNFLRDANEGSNPGLHRVAFKMATGSGKTLVMAMLIAWQALNKLEHPQDTRFTDTFLLIAPGITIRDRLRVLLPSDPSTYYHERDIIPPDMRERLGHAKILITNFHALRQRELSDAPPLTKRVARQGTNTNAFLETPDQMVRRVCRELGAKKHILIINDEAHHCYRRRPDAEDEKLTREDAKDVKQRDEEARVWISGIEAIQHKIGIKAIYDLSATPFFLKGSGYDEGTLFPWVVSDFSLIDAIECGIVKVPRVPVADDTMQGEQPMYRDLWNHIREDLPKKGRGTDGVHGEPKLPAELQGAIHSLYSNYEKAYQRWQQNTEATAHGQTPPVFILVCNNTNVSKLVFDYIAGWAKALPDGTTVLVPGALDIFSNIRDGRWLARPNTILVDSQQLDSGASMSAEFKKIAAHQIDEFKAEYRARFPGRDAEQLTEEDILREVMNTVGKPGKLGEQVKCVVSVSMLTEGWDANTVTHILGVRAFGTQLLCEQVVGRGLRRMSYAAEPCMIDVQGKQVAIEAFTPEYAEVYGVPFSFLPCTGSNIDRKPRLPTRVRALEDRIVLELCFPRLVGYRFDLPVEHLHHQFGAGAHMALSTAQIPTRVENAPIVGERSIHTLDDLKQHRVAEVAFRLAKLTYEKYFRDEVQGDRPWLYPQILQITKAWLASCVTCKDHAFLQLLLLHELAQDAADTIFHAIVRGSVQQAILKPILRPYETWGSTRYVDFDTTRQVYVTHPAKCHISHVVADTESWEQKAAQSLEEMDEVLAYVKNQGLGFAIPYTLNGDNKQYLPDFLVKFDDGNGRDDPLMLMVEVSGEARKDKAVKAETARTLWVPAVNNHGGLGRWMYLEITDPWDMQRTIRGAVQHYQQEQQGQEAA
jgi:type III restriction enzyme